MTTDDLLTDFTAYVFAIIPRDADPEKVARAILAMEADLAFHGFGHN